MDNAALNRAIAERVMGLSVEFNMMLSGNTWYPLPDYSGDIAAAFIVVRHMHTLGYTSRLSYQPSCWASYREWEMIFTKGIRHTAAVGETPALAICMAAIHTINDSVSQSNPDGEDAE